MPCVCSGSNVARVGVLGAERVWVERESGWRGRLRPGLRVWELVLEAPNGIEEAAHLLLGAEVTEYLLCRIICATEALA